MSDLSATNCGCGSMCGGDDNNCLFLILILLFCGGFGGCGNGCGCGSMFGGDGNNSCFLIILLLLFCGGGCGNSCGCGCNNNLGC